MIPMLRRLSLAALAAAALGAAPALAQTHAVAPAGGPDACSRRGMASATCAATGSLSAFSPHATAAPRCSRHLTPAGWSTGGVRCRSIAAKPR